MYKGGTLKYESEVIVHPKDICDILNMNDNTVRGI